MTVSADSGLSSRSEGASPSETANQNTATGAIVGTPVGAGMGAAIGAATGNAGAGAAIGGGVGLLGGTAMGSNAGASSEYTLQKRYDIAYQQCMYAKGNQIPGVVRQPARAYAHHHRHPRRVTAEVHGSRYRVSMSMANGYPNIGCRYHRVPGSRSRLQGHPLRTQALMRRHLRKEPDEERGMRAFQGFLRAAIPCIGLRRVSDYRWACRQCGLAAHAARLRGLRAGRE